MNETQLLYREVFLKTSIGRSVLALMLKDLFFFSQTQGPDEVALANYAKKLLSDCGIFNYGLYKNREIQTETTDEMMLSVIENLSNVIQGKD